jgi:hypothetical protein
MKDTSSKVKRAINSSFKASTPFGYMAAIPCSVRFVKVISGQSDLAASAQIAFKMERYGANASDV